MSESDEKPIEPKAEGDSAPAEGVTEAQSPSEGPDTADIAVRSESEVKVTSTAVAPDEEDTAALELGAQKYVHASFFLAGILVSFLFGKLLNAAWSTLLDFPDVVKAVPQLLEYSEDQRGSITLVIGAVLGVLAILRYYRRPSVKKWATDVATELARVTWPDKETVTNGTIVVLVAGSVATLYVAVLDRFWGYVTNLIYGS